MSHRKYKVVLADDEMLILRGLKKLVDWEKLSVSIVGEAHNGEEIMELIEQKKPDIIISDICMPNMTGLEMLKIISEKKLGIKVIFISGYQEFSYARDAVTYGAVDYILKPVQKDKLEKAVEKAELELQKEQKLKIFGTAEQEKEVRRILKKAEEKEDEEKLYEELKKLEIDIRDREMVTVGIRLLFLKSYSEGNKFGELMSFSVFNKIHTVLKEQKMGFILKKEGNTCFFNLLLDSGDEEDEIRKKIQKILKNIQNYEQYAVKVGVGGKISAAKQIVLGYKMAVFALELYYFTEEAFIWYDKIEKDFTDSVEDYQNRFQRLLACFTEKHGVVENEVGILLSVIRNLHFGNRFAAANRCVLLVHDMTKELIKLDLLDSSFEKNEECIEVEIRKKGLYRSVCGCVTEYFEQIRQEILENGNQQYREVTRIKQYLEEHYRENISLESMAEVFNMNPYYFSSYFKKNIGENFKAYLTEIRMNHARMLLQATDMKAYQIALEVGYKNVRQFNENFKTKYGISPGEYRKSYEKKS